MPTGHAAYSFRQSADRSIKKVRTRFQAGSTLAHANRAWRRLQVAAALPPARRYHSSEKRRHAKRLSNGGEMRIRSLLSSSLIAWLALLGATLAPAIGFPQTYPSKAVRLVVTYPPAGSSDLMARILAEKLAEAWGQPVIVENKPGAAGSIGMEYAKQQPA